MELSEEAYGKAAQAEADERNDRTSCTRSPSCPLHPTCDGGCPPIMRPIEGKWGVV